MAARWQRDTLNEVVTGFLHPLVDQDLSVVFYDLTTCKQLNQLASASGSMTKRVSGLRSMLT